MQVQAQVTAWCFKNLVRLSSSPWQKPRANAAIASWVRLLNSAACPCKIPIEFLSRMHTPLQTVRNVPWDTPWFRWFGPLFYPLQKVQNVWAVARRRRRLENKTFEAADYELYDSKVRHLFLHSTYWLITFSRRVLYVKISAQYAQQE